MSPRPDKSARQVDMHEFMSKRGQSPAIESEATKASTFKGNAINPNFISPLIDEWSMYARIKDLEERSKMK